MLKEITRRLLGYVCVSARGEGMERFLTLCAKNSIRVWGVRRTPEGFAFCAGTYAYALLRPLRRKCGLRLRITEKHGLRFFLRPTLRRRGLLLGAALFLLTVLFLNAHIWRIEVSGSETIPEAEILEAAHKLGLREGMLKSRLDAPLLREELMLELPGVSWAAVNTLGCTVTVAVKEKTPKPEILDRETPCDLIAAFTGQIVEIESFSGSALVKAGDAVERGQLLVAGTVRNELGETAALEHASGRVIARVRLVFSAEIPKQVLEKVPTGEVRRRASAVIFGVEVPLSLSGAPQEESVRTLSRFPFSIGAVELPFEIVREEWTLLAEEPRILGREEARRRALDSIMAQLAEACPAGQIERKSVSYEEREAGISATGVFIVQTDIAQECEIAQEDGEA